MKTYSQLLNEAMLMCSQYDESIFVGQAVEYSGTAMSNTLDGIDLSKRLELPVDEDFQLGLSIGMSFAGKLVISLFPRWNFLLLATNQLVNHLDKLEALGIFGQQPLIIRTGIGSIHPLDPGPQHTGDFTNSIRSLCQNLEVVRLDSKEMILPEYEKALSGKNGKSTILVEWSDKYND